MAQIARTRLVKVSVLALCAGMAAACSTASDHTEVIKKFAEATGSVLRVCVADNGRGLAESAGPGVGLANIESRLASDYGHAARLELAQNDLGGVSAVIELPLRRPPSSIGAERRLVAA